jgi:hypothetical protein
VKIVCVKNVVCPKENPTGKQLGTREKCSAIAADSRPGIQHKCWYIMQTAISTIAKLKISKLCAATAKLIYQNLILHGGLVICNQTCDQFNCVSL